MKNPLKHNVGLPDRVLRVVVGISLVTLGTLTSGSTTGIVLIVLSIPLLFSGITGFCPTYTLFGISTAAPMDRMMPRAMNACCSPEGKIPACPPVTKAVTEEPGECPGHREAAAESEGRGR